MELVTFLEAFMKDCAVCGTYQLNTKRGEGETWLTAISVLEFP